MKLGFLQFEPLKGRPLETVERGGVPLERRARRGLDGAAGAGGHGVPLLRAARGARGGFAGRGEPVARAAGVVLREERRAHGHRVLRARRGQDLQLGRPRGARRRGRDLPKAAPVHGREGHLRARGQGPAGPSPSPGRGWGSRSASTGCSRRPGAASPWTARTSSATRRTWCSPTPSAPPATHSMINRVYTITANRIGRDEDLEFHRRLPGDRPGRGGDRVGRHR